MTDMPDFDKMTQEEMMLWMESLAKRQGATEGLLTSADAAVPEVDANDERLQGMGEYIPHGWTREQWEAQLAKEAAQKASKAAAAPPPPAPKPVPPPVQAAPPPAPKPAPPPIQAAPPPPAPKPAASSPVMLDPSKMSEAEIMAALETMSPDDMLRFMEKLAMRQGATEGIINADIDDLDVPEVDESDARLVGQKRYVPSGLTKDQEAKWLAEEEERERRLREQRAAQPPARPAAPPARPAAPPPAPVASTPSADDLLKPPSFEDLFSANNILPPLQDDDEPTAPVVDLPPAVADPMDWLAGLADETSSASLDLGNLGDLSAGLGSLSQLEQPASDPMDWLAGLADEPAPRPAAPLPVVERFEADMTFGSDIDPIAFMETLASQHGAPSEELTTTKRLDIKRPSSLTSEDPGYQPYSFEEDEDILPVPASPALPAADLGPLDDPEAWLDQLATSANPGRPAAEEIAVDDVITALNQGKDVPPDLVDAFFQKQFERAAQIEDEDEGTPFFEPSPSTSELPPIEANIPDWLQEQFGGPPPELAAAPSTDAESFFADLGLDEPSAPTLAKAELPSWLSEDLDDGQSAVPIPAPMDFFTDVAEPIQEEAPLPTLSFDVDDPLVIALTQEAEDQAQLERWYQNQMSGIGKESSPPPAAPQGLAQAELPVETQLQAGEAQAMPAWLSGEIVEEEPQAIQTIPDWLQEQASDALPDWLVSQDDESIAMGDEESLPDWLAAADVDIAPDDIPDWLRETIVEEEQPIIPSAPPAPSAPSVPVPPPAPLPQPPAALAPVSPPRSPVPTPQRVRIDVAATLERARANLRQDIAASLQDYEAVVRANEALDAVVADLSKLAEDKEQKKNPAIYRVLGDALMRRGNLQEALAVYRRALNLL